MQGRLSESWLLGVLGKYIIHVWDQEPVNVIG
jgi:hypothetical protein